ncbi:MAG: hypothetical protein U0P30_16025 [Vicinamibacterales bacterium]
MPTTFAVLGPTTLTILLLSGNGGPIGNAGNARQPATESQPPAAPHVA